MCPNNEWRLSAIRDGISGSFVLSLTTALGTLSYHLIPRNSAWKFGRKIQNHWDNNAFCAVGSFILPHPVGPYIYFLNCIFQFFSVYYRIWWIKMYLASTLPVMNLAGWGSLSPQNKVTAWKKFSPLPVFGLLIRTIRWSVHVSKFGPDRLEFAGVIPER